MTNESQNPAIDLIESAKRDAQAIIDEQKRLIAGYNKALTALKPSPAQEATPKTRNHSMNVGEAIVYAVEHGCTTPTQVLEYLETGLGITTTLNSVRARLSPLKKEGKIAHDGNGWVPINKEVKDLLS